MKEASTLAGPVAGSPHPSSAPNPLVTRVAPARRVGHTELSYPREECYDPRHDEECLDRDSHVVDVRSGPAMCADCSTGTC